MTLANENTLKDILQQDSRLAHIHIIPKSSMHWFRHIAFKKYLIEHDGIRQEYQGLKERLSLMEWDNSQQYNAAKNDFIKYHEVQAML